MTRCDVCCRLVPLGPTCASCMAWSWRILGGLGVVVMALTMWGCGDSDDEESVRNPLAPSAAAVAPVADYQPATRAAPDFMAAAPPSACIPNPGLVDRAERFRAMNDRPPGYAKNWRETLLFFGVDHADNALMPVEPVTVATLRQRELRWQGWRPFRVEAERLLSCGWTPPTPTTTTVTTPEPEPQADAGTAHFVGASPLGFRGATATSTPVLATMGEDDHYGVEFTVARSGSNRVCLDGVDAWRGADYNFGFYGLDSENCIAEARWKNGQATVTGHGATVDNNVVDPDRFLSLSIKATSETTPAGGDFLLTVINDDWLWVQGRIGGGQAWVHLGRRAGDRYSVRATMYGPGWTVKPDGFRFTKVVAPGVEGNLYFNEVYRPSLGRDCSKGEAWVHFSAFPTEAGSGGAASGIRQEHLRLYEWRLNLC